MLKATLVVTALLPLLGAPVLRAEGVKIICAARTEKAVQIDGVLDEPAWQRADAIEDFLEIGDPVPHPTRMRLLYDSKTLYLGVECMRPDVAPFKKEIADFQASYKGRENSVLQYGLEVFLDPGASGVNSYQFVVNVAGETIARFKTDWDPFPVKPTYRSRLTDKGWSIEIAFPLASMRGAKLVEGEQWGFNLVRNDRAACVIWKPVGTVFYTPSQYGRMMVGDYATWWRRKVEEEAVSQVADVGRRMDRYQASNRWVKPLYDAALSDIQSLHAIKDKNGLKTRQGFVTVYRKSPAVAAAVHRLRALCATLDGEPGADKGSK